MVPYHYNPAPNSRRGVASAEDNHRRASRLHAKKRARERYGLSLGFFDILRHENSIETVSDNVYMIHHTDKCIFFELKEGEYTFYPVWNKSLGCISTYFACREWSEAYKNRSRK